MPPEKHTFPQENARRPASELKAYMKTMDSLVVAQLYVDFYEMFFFLVNLDSKGVGDLPSWKSCWSRLKNHLVELGFFHHLSSFQLDPSNLLGMRNHPWNCYIYVDLPNKKQQNVRVKIPVPWMLWEVVSKTFGLEFISIVYWGCG